MEVGESSEILGVECIFECDGEVEWLDADPEDSARGDSGGPQHGCGIGEAGAGLWGGAVQSGQFADAVVVKDFEQICAAAEADGFSEAGGGICGVLVQVLLSGTCCEYDWLAKLPLRAAAGGLNVARALARDLS